LLRRVVPASQSRLIVKISSQPQAVVISGKALPDQIYFTLILSQTVIGLMRSKDMSKNQPSYNLAHYGLMIAR
jgi:hypothetical protein